MFNDLQRTRTVSWGLHLLRHKSRREELHREPEEGARREQSQSHWSRPWAS